jgi:hypothetical protein
METIKTTSLTILDSYLLANAQGLIKYAKTDPTFALWLTTHLPSLPHPLKVSLSSNLNLGQAVTPTTADKAFSIANWLHNQIHRHPTRTKHTNAYLHAWVESYQAPKDQIFGIVGIAIIGPTLGLIRSKKKKKSQLHVVVDKKWQTELSAMNFTGEIQKLSMGVISRELKLARGNVYHLHPDSAEWCLDEAVTKVYQAEQPALSELLSFINAEHVPHFARYEDGALVGLAVSPSFNDQLLTDFEIRAV